MDLTDSFGFKSRSYGIGYGVTFDYNEKTDISAFVKYINENNHSAVKSNSAITDNIGEFDSFEFQLSYYFNTTNDILYPIVVHLTIFRLHIDQTQFQTILIIKLF